MQSRKELLFFLLGMIALPGVAVSDDPCQESSAAVAKLTTALSQPAIAQARQGKFASKQVNGDFVISYTVKGRTVFEQRYPYTAAGPGDDIDEITPVIFHGHESLFIRHTQGNSLACMYVISPAPPSKRFMAHVLTQEDVFTMQGAQRAAAAKSEERCHHLYHTALTECRGETRCDAGINGLSMVSRRWVDTLANRTEFDKLCQQVCTSRQLPDRHTFDTLLCGSS